MRKDQHHTTVQAFIRVCERLFNPSMREVLTQEDIGVIQVYIRDLMERFGTPVGDHEDGRFYVVLKGAA